MNIPDDLRYTESHEWVRLEGDAARVGITDHAQAELTDIVYVELPKVGTLLTKAQPAAVVESVKAASDIYAPIGGTVTEGNPALATDPGLINRDPYGDGWLFRVKIEAGEQIETLKTAAEYRKQISQPGEFEV